MDTTRTSTTSSAPSQSKYSDVGLEGIRKVTTIAKWLLRLLLVSNNSTSVEMGHGQKITATCLS